MKKYSRDVPLWLVTACASSAIAAGCGSRQSQDGWQTCVDQHGRVADERQCDSRAPGYNLSLYRWYYYPFGGRPYPIGYGVPTGGTYASEPFAGVRRAGVGPATRAPVAGEGVARGGFGSTAAGKSSAGG